MSKSRDIADSAATINFIDTVTSNVQTQLNTLDTAIDNISVTSGTLTKTFISGESASISLTSSVLAPVVSVTKEVPQSGVTNNNWDVNSTTENYTRLDSAAATTLSFVGYGISTASFVGSFSVSGQDTSQQDIAFNSDGTKMFVVGRGNDSVYEYTLSTAFDILTASYVQSFSVTSQEIQPQGLAFNTDGTKMFVVGGSGDDVNEYTLSTGFNISTATFVDSFSVSAQSISPQSVRFNSDGTIMFVLGNSADSVFQYTLSTAFDVSTASYSSISFSVASQEANPRGLSFSPDGTKMFVVGDIGDSVNEYTLSTAFNVSTASYSQNFSVATQDSGPTGIAFNLDGTKMFVVGEGNNSVYEYTLPLSLALGTGSFASADVGKTIEANSGAFVLTATDGSYVQTTAPTSYAQVASGSWSMYGVVYNAVDGDLELSAYVNNYNLTVATYDQSFSVATQDTAPVDIVFSPDGTKMFILGDAGGDVNEYTLSTSFDVSTATFVSSFSIAAQDGGPQGLAFSTDGTKMYMVGTGADTVFQYSLSTSFSLGTASYSGINFSVASQDTAPSGLTFSLDGTKMFVLGSSTDSVYEYTLSTAFSVGTASYVVGFSVASQETVPRGIAFSADGKKMFVCGTTGQDVNEYTLSIGFDVSTASYSQVFSVAAQDTAPYGIAFSNTGDKMFIVGQTGDAVYEYSTGAATYPTGYQPVHTTASTDTTYWTDINSMTADQNAGSGNIYYAISTDDRTTWTVIDNTDGERDIVRNNAGTWQYNSNGTYASQTWVNGTTNTELATLAESMEGAVVTTQQYNISTAVFVDNFSVSAQDTSPYGFSFSSTGHKMYVVGITNDSVYEYALSTNFDISTASYTTSFSVAAQDTSPTDVVLSTDGTKMFVLGDAGNDVNEYTLSTAYDVSSASFVDSFSVSAQETDPWGLAFNPTGTKMFVLGYGTDTVHEYTLSTGFDVSSASYSQGFSVAAQDTIVTGVDFSADGTQMFVLGNATQDVFQYSLSTGFDVSTASYVRTFEVNIGGVAKVRMNNDGTKMFTINYSSQNVGEYTLGTTSYTNQMDKTQLDAVTDPNHIALGNDLDLAIVFNMTSGSTVPSSDGVAINYDANVLNKGAVLGTDYDFDAPAQNSARITALTSGNFKVRVV